MTCGCCACIATNESKEGALKALVDSVESGDIASGATIHLITEAGEIADDTSTNVTLPDGETLQSQLEENGDQDWVRFTADNTGDYDIALSGVGDNGLGDPYLRVYDSSGTLIGGNDDGGPGYNSALTIELTAGETYYFEAAAYGNSYSGDYQLSATFAGGGGDDAIPGDSSTNASVAVGGAFEGTLETNGDDDWIKLTISEDGAYTIALDGSGGDPLNDPYLRLYDADGNLVDSNDDGGSGYNSQLSVTLNSGDYYISARAYGDNSSGDYTVSVTEGGGGGGGSGEALVDAIDWGTQLNTATVKVYFAAEGETLGGVTSAKWLDYEVDAALDSLDDIARFTNLSYEQVFSADEADFKLVVANNIGGGLGWFYPPGAGGADTGVGAFQRTGNGWDKDGLAEGGYGRVTLTHEFGHGLGLAHPHDDGGSSVVMDGVGGAFGDYGDHLLNQGVFTTMSYNTGWDAENGDSHSTDYGWENGFAALDMAVLQDKYGVNDAYATGDDAYAMADSNEAGTFYETIWDADGTDTISYDGRADATIDLRAATLEYESGGAGFISYVDGVLGGFTIANGVEIENAQGGRGSDEITGNGARNDLRGGRGADNIDGGDRADWLRGNGGRDTIEGGSGNDRMWGGGGADTFVFNAGDGVDRILKFQDGSDMMQMDIAGLAFDDLTVSQNGNNTHVDYGDGEIILTRTDANLITEDDFIFV